MTQKKEITVLAYSGRIFSIEFYQLESGEVLAEEWLENMPQNIQQKFAALFVWMGDHGRINNEKKFKHLTGSDQIFEFKAGQRIILTNGYVKKAQKTPAGEIEKAEALKQEFMRREMKQ